jgi:hypothetical protein
MILINSLHWQRKRKRRPDITDDLIDYAVAQSPLFRDRRWDDLFNAICDIPPSGRRLKVVWKRLKTQEIKVITAYWLD